MSENSPPDGFTSLYRIYGADRSLLYVGISLSAFRRLSEHRAAKAWWSESAFVRIAHFDSRAEADQAERRAIQAEKPKYNIEHNDGIPVAPGYMSPRLNSMLREAGDLPPHAYRIIRRHGFQVPEDLWPRCSNCERSQPVVKRLRAGLCAACYQRRRRHGTLGTPDPKSREYSEMRAASPPAC